MRADLRTERSSAPRPLVDGLWYFPGPTIVELLPNNRDLLVAFRAGERSALTEVYWHYVDDVERYLRAGFLAGDVRIAGLSDPDQLKDVLQETFSRAFSPRARQTYDGLRSYRPYLRRIARNLLIDRSRMAGRLVLGADEGLEAATPSDDASPHETLEHRRLAEATRSFVGTLDAQMQTIVRLRFEEGRSQEDVAREVGVTRRRIRTLEGRVRKDLIDHLTAHGLRLEDYLASP